MKNYLLIFILITYINCCSISNCEFCHISFGKEICDACGYMYKLENGKCVYDTFYDYFLVDLKIIHV